MNTQDINLFPCYSWNLVKFLNSKGFKYKLIGVNEVSHKKFWVYIRDKELNSALDIWKTTKPIT